MESAAERAPSAAGTADPAEPAGTAGPAETGAETGAETSAERSAWDDPRLPWRGKPRTADILCWLGIVLSGLFYWLLLPLRLRLIGTHPVQAELLNGSTEAIISAAAFARVGNGTLPVVLLAAIPGLMKFDLLYWWAGRLWGERFILTMAGSRRAARHMARAERAGRRFTWPAIVISSFLPIPRAVIFAVAGWTRVRVTTFLLLDLIGVLAWAGLLAGLGYGIGHQAVVAAKTVSRYSLWITIAIVVVTFFVVLRSQRRLAAEAGPPADPAG